MSELSVFWGIALLVVGFVLRVQPLLVVAASALLTGYLGGIAWLDLLAVIGVSFRSSRFLLLVVLVLPLVALLESEGLRERLKKQIALAERATLPRVLLSYFVGRQVTAACGLTSLGGQAQSVRPLLVPLAEGSAMQRYGVLKHAQVQRLRAFCAGTDNVALFFGEDIFLAFGAVLLIQASMAGHGYLLDPLHIALWGIPTALLALLIHSVRIARFSL